MLDNNEKTKLKGLCHQKWSNFEKSYVLLYVRFTTFFLRFTKYFIMFYFGLIAYASFNIIIFLNKGLSNDTSWHDNI